MEYSVISISRNIAVNTLVSYAGRIIGSVFGLATIGLITRSLGQEGFGEYTTVLAYLSLFMILGDLGLQPLMTREISRRQDNGAEVASNFFTLRLIASCIFLFAGFALVFVFPYSQGVKLGVGVGLTGFLSLSLSQLLLAVFQKHFAMHFAALAEVLGRGAQFLLVYAIFVGAGNGDEAGYAAEYMRSGEFFLYLAALSIAAFLIFALQFYFARRYIKIGLRLQAPRVKKILRDAWPIALSVVLTIIYFKIDTIFLSLMKPQEDVGIYGVAYRMLESLIFFPAIFAGIVMPILSREAQDMQRFGDVFKKSFRVVTMFAVPVMAGGIVLSYSIVGLIGGPDFLAAGAPMQALFIAVGLIFFGNILGRAVIALDLQKKAMVAYLFGVILNVALNFIFIPKYSYMGAAWTTVATEFLITAFLFWIVWKAARVSFDIPGAIKTAFAAAVMAGALLIYVWPITAPVSFLGVLAAMVFGAGVYFGTLIAVGGVRREEILEVLRGR